MSQVSQVSQLFYGWAGLGGRAFVFRRTSSSAEAPPDALYCLEVKILGMGPGGEWLTFTDQSEIGTRPGKR